MAYGRAKRQSYDEECARHWKRRAYVYQQHHVRFVAFVKNRKPRLICQDCRGEGGYQETIDPEIGGPWEKCGWCEGTGYMTAHQRGLWLYMMKTEKAAGHVYRH